MALVDEYKLALENDTQFRQRLLLAVTKVIIQAMPPTVANPPAAHQALAKRFMISPEGEVQRYLLPVAARLAINGGSFDKDADLVTAVQQVLVLNAYLGIV